MALIDQENTTWFGSDDIIVLEGVNALLISFDGDEITRTCNRLSQHKSFEFK
jgi:hypothetical protein